MKGILLSTPKKSRRILLSVLLRLERVSYRHFLFGGTLGFSLLALIIWAVGQSKRGTLNALNLILGLILVCMMCSIPYLSSWLVKPGVFIVRKLEPPRAELERFMRETEDEYNSVP